METGCWLMDPVVLSALRYELNETTAFYKDKSPPLPKLWKKHPSY